MKLAFIREKYDPFGGSEIFTQAIIEKLTPEHFQIHVIARNWKPLDYNRMKFHKIRCPGFPSLLRHAAFVFFTGRVLRKGNFDLVQSNERVLGANIYRAGDGVHARWLEIRRKHGSILKRLSIYLNPFHHFICALERRLFQDPRLDAVIVNSEMVGKEIISFFGFDNHRIHKIYNGVDLEKYHPKNRDISGMALRHANQIGPDQVIVLFVGSGFERKGLEILIKSLVQTSPRFVLWVVGKGKHKKYRQLAKTSGVENRVIFKGPSRQTAQFYAAADIFAFPTLYDPFPSVVLEAMASGLPVIVSSRCGAAEIIEDQKQGFIIDPPENISRLAGFLNKLGSKKLRKTMSEHARKCAERFSIQHAVSAYERLYADLSERKASKVIYDINSVGKSHG